MDLAKKAVNQLPVDQVQEQRKSSSWAMRVLPAAGGVMAAAGAAHADTGTIDVSTVLAVIAAVVVAAAAIGLAILGAKAGIKGYKMVSGAL